MSGKDKVRLGVVGIGVMGTNHLRSTAAAGNLTVAAVCDIRKERADRAAAEYKVPAFYSHRELLESGLIDAVLIVTPHYSHTPIAIDAFRAGIHVLSDKPVAVHVADARRMLAAQREAGNLKFGVMFQLRTSPANIAFKKLLDSGEL
ncbi:Gfo/Idh/MocA family protein, partial [Victivallis vadensis]|uniref:Gfo/Idh/MocA family protein n=1 Tax=Victivallis vadensis TaxID=172901 RepID=UPI003AF66718